MSTKKNKGASVASVMQDLLGGPAPEKKLPAEQPEVEEKESAAPQPEPEPEAEPKPEKPIEETRPVRKVGRPHSPDADKHIKRSYYLHADIIEELRKKQFYEPLESISAHVERALRAYLKM